MSEKVKKMENMAKMEEDYALSLASSVKGLGNLGIRELLRSIASDSQKHAGFYKTIAGILKGESQPIVEEEFEVLEETIKEHIETERQMLREVKQLLRDEKDDRVKRLLTEIHADETQHHALMKNLLEIVIKRETIFEEHIWDMLWKDVPTHGAPEEAITGGPP
ncbi:MAG: ferritin family protein [Candidatus Bathyarchaeia archaeon]